MTLSAAGRSPRHGPAHSRRMASQFFTTSSIWEVHTQGERTKTVLVLQGIGVSEAISELCLLLFSPS